MEAPERGAGSAKPPEAAPRIQLPPRVGHAQPQKQEHPMGNDVQTPTPLANNVMRHGYRALNKDESEQMLQVKDVGLAFHDLCEKIGASRELSLAKTKIEEAVMWAVKHITR